jgi:hypothetical protein
LWVAEAASELALVADFAAPNYEARSTTLMNTPLSAPTASANPISAPDMLHDNAAFSSRLHSSWPCVLASKIDGIIFYVVDPLPRPDRMNMQKSVDAYRDPWQDGREPVTEGQFRRSLSLLPPPQVPVR